MLRMLEAQAPAKQTAGETISTLSNRLNNSTLLEDRRAAILGLRSFAKQYPASVASGSLRGLIGCLTKDLEDVDTTKVVLETLLMLFNPDEQSPEASEDIALWLADEFTQRQDNIKLLLELLETTEFYPRLYSLQLISAIYAARPQRTQECVLNAALGASRLVSTLDDPRDAVRNAGLLLLSDLTSSSTELQKLIAFESAFDRVFSLIEVEGGLRQGGIVVQDCLELLANLIKNNASNQSLFRESGCVLKLSALLRKVDTPQENGAEDSWPSPQEDKSLWGLLAVLRLFLTPGSVGTLANQTAFRKHGLLQQVLHLAFSQSTAPPIKAEALNTCSDMIRGNPDIQAGFAQLQVPLSLPHPATKENGATNGAVTAYVIDALLELVLAPSATTEFDIRLAACECIKAYFYNHTQIRLHFLHRAIEGHLAGEDETPNIVTSLMQQSQDTERAHDPHRVWFASVILLHLIQNDPEAKKILMGVSEGDAADGEEVITCIQVLAGNLVAAIQTNGEERTVLAYFMMLCSWLFEDPDAVNDFLGEASNLQVLMQTAKSSLGDLVVVRGLCSILLGITYEFSTKDSPIPRKKLQGIIMSGLGREMYIQSMASLRQHPLIRDFEVLAQGAGTLEAGLELPPYAYLDQSFVEFLKDNFSRLRRAIDRDPGMETQVALGNVGIDRDLVDTLRTELEGKTQALQKAEANASDLQRRLEQEQASLRKTQETATADVNRIKAVNDALHKNHEDELATIRNSHQTAAQEQQAVASRRIEQLTAEVKKIQEDSSNQAAHTKEYYERSITQLRTSKKDLETKFSQTSQQKDAISKELTDLKKALTMLQKDHDTARKELAELRNAAKDLAEAKKSMVQLRKESETTKKDLGELQNASKELATSKQSTSRLQKELDAAKKELSSLRANNEKQQKNLQKLETAKTETENAAEDERTRVSMLEKEVTGMESTIKKLEAKAKAAEKAAEEKEQARKATQTELDDMVMVFGDLEEKRAKDKARLKALGEEVSEAEDDEDEDEDEDGDDEDEDVD